MNLSMEISKLAVLHANEHQSNQKKKVTKDFRINFLYVFVHAKNDSVSGMPENVASRRILTKMTASVFHRT